MRQLKNSVILAYRTKIVVLLLCISFFSGCLFLTKPLARKVSVSFNKDFEVRLIKNDASDMLSNFNEDDYRKEYIKAFEKTLTQNNMLITEENPEYRIKIYYIELKENIKYDTIKNVSSVDYGKIFELTTAKVYSCGDVIKQKDSKKRTWSAEKYKSEKAKSNRTLGQVIAKDENEDKKYREKTFHKEQFLIQTSNCAYKAGNQVTRYVKRLLKK